MEAPLNNVQVDKATENTGGTFNIQMLNIGGVTDTCGSEMVTLTAYKIVP